MLEAEGKRVRVNMSINTSSAHRWATLLGYLGPVLHRPYIGLPPLIKVTPPKINVQHLALKLPQKHCVSLTPPAPGNLYLETHPTLIYYDQNLMIIVNLMRQTIFSIKMRL
jgi:hypothetical protein